MARRPADPTPASTSLAPQLRPAEEAGGLSLDQLSAALVGMFNAGADPYQAPEASDVALEIHSRADSNSAAAQSAVELSPRSILEAMLFVGNPQNEPLSSQQVASLMRGVRPAEIDALVRELNRDYDRRNCPYRIVDEGPGYRMTLREEFARVRDRFYGKTRQARLSQAAIEVLAAVAYHEPVTSEQVTRLRGVPSGHVLSQLVRRQLLRVEHEGKPRRTHYFTTPRFLALFGIKSLDELPRGQELEEA